MTQYDIWLNGIPGVGSGVILRLWKAMEERQDFAEALYCMDPERRKELAQRALADIHSGRIVRDAAESLYRGNPESPDHCMERVKQEGIQCTCICDPDYPDRLRNIPDPPFALYYYGHLPSDERPSVGIVGTRMASPYGREQARRFAMKLAEHGIQIVSGMARGIDGVAGKGAVDAGPLFSFAVLGCGVDICYPKENLDLYERLRDQGGVLSEYPPGTLPEARLFPSRNRIISGLSDVILVIEAKEKSGTLITVDQALEQGKDVFALPGRVSDPNSTGCNNLIRQGAGIALSPETLLEYLDRREGRRGGDICKRLTDHVAAEEPEDRDRTRKEKRPHQLSFDFEVLSGPEVDRENREELSETKAVGRCPVGIGFDDLEREIYDHLDESEPVDLDHILPDVSKELGRSIEYPEALRCVTKMALKGLVREVRVGNYVSVK